MDKFDIAIIGGGPAGFTAAHYGCRAGFTTIVFEKASHGGQMGITSEIENYPGFAHVDGFELAMKMMEPLTAMGIEPTYGTVRAIGKIGHDFEVVTDGARYTARAVIVATGVGHRKLGVPGEERLIGRGISFCATCDGMFFRGQEVAVVGGGNTAVQDALVLSELCSRVYLIHRRDAFRAEARLVERMKSTANIDCITDTVVCEMQGEPKLESLLLRNVKTEETRTLPVAGVFLAVGNIARNEALRELIELDESGFIVTNADCKTSHAGIFAAGDCRQKKVRQLTTATADGTVAALSAVEYLDL